MSMKTSQAGIDLIKNYESLRLDAHDVEGRGKLTIGYGHYDDPNVTEGMIITEAQAEAYLREDLRKHEAHVNRAVNVPLTQNQFDALVSFSFNTGASASDTVYEEINKGKFDKAMIELAGWRGKGTSTYPGLKRRRNDEIELFMGGDTVREYDSTDHYEERFALKNFIRDAVRQGLEDGTIGADQIQSLDRNMSREFYEHFFEGLSAAGGGSHEDELPTVGGSGKDAIWGAGAGCRKGDGRAADFGAAGSFELSGQ
ncbi:MAG: lysozyme, partial [Pseudomonadota bacterium]